MICFLRFAPLAAVRFAPVNSVPKTFVSEIEHCAGNVRKDNNLQGSIVPVGDGKNYESI